MFKCHCTTWPPTTVRDTYTWGEGTFSGMNGFPAVKWKHIRNYCVEDRKCEQGSTNTSRICERRSTTGPIEGWSFTYTYTDVWCDCGVRSNNTLPYRASCVRALLNMVSAGRIVSVWWGESFLPRKIRGYRCEQKNTTYFTCSSRGFRR